MAPPPNSGDATNKNDDDPLGGMDPMAWLESLAARQGANPDELVTAANLDIPVLPADTYIDEPGYTPGYDTGKSDAVRAEASKKPEPVKAVEPPPPPQAEPVMAAASDDPLGGMDPMAWLESLAARQGANPDELVTAANLDIPVLPADTYIDEPGYTPGYDTGKSDAVRAEASKKPEPVKAVEPPPPPPQAEPVMAAASDDPLGGMDPMAWLESLAARQGANPDELVTAANLDIPVLPADTYIDEPGYTPGYDTGKSDAVRAEASKKPEPVKAVEPPPPPPQAEPVMAAASDDPLGGMDPMAWLESLAARQGANPDELVTAANLDIPVLPADTYIDEPGYVDYDPFGSGVSRAGEMPRTPELTPTTTPEPALADDPLGGMDPLAWLESLTDGSSADQVISSESMGFSMTESSVELPTDFESEAEAMPAMSLEEAAELLGIEPVASVDIDDPLGGMDPLAWLESLAARQGANLDELVTGGTLDLPAVTEAEGAAENTDYSPFAAMNETSGGAMAPESALSWLEELAKEQAGAIQAAPPEPVAAAPSETGGSSQDINEVQAWLFEQARNLESTRDELEAEDAHAGELPPAEPAELPDWLAGSISQTPAASSIIPALSNEISTPIAPSDLPSWLAQPEPDASLEEILGALQGISAASPATPPVVEEVAPHIATSELEALVRPSSPEAVDSWAEALDEEYERRLAGDESVPDWYMEALTRAETEPESAGVSQSASEQISMAEMFAEPAADAAPINWLEETAEPALPGEVPDWLRGMAQPVDAPPPVPAPAASMDWLPDVQSEDMADLPDWLKPAAQAQTLEVVQVTPEPEPPKPAPVVPEVPVKPPEPVQKAVPAAPTAPAAPPAPKPAPVAPKPAPQPIARPAAASAEPAVDHPVRLKQARELVTTNQYAASLEHYQVLIDSSQLLEETRGDLRDLVEINPADPKLRRLLGDTHMRLGDLQAALDTYRSALDQL